MMGDQEGQAVLDVNASSLGLKFLHGQSENKAPLSLPTSGSHPLPLMLLPAPTSTAEGGEYESKTLRQLQAEQDDEERFQADLEQALQQSLKMQLENLEEGSSEGSLWKQSPLESSGSVAAPHAEAAIGSIPRSEQPMERTSSGTEALKNLQLSLP